MYIYMYESWGTFKWVFCWFFLASKNYMATAVAGEVIAFSSFMLLSQNNLIFRQQFVFNVVFSVINWCIFQTTVCFLFCILSLTLFFRRQFIFYVIVSVILILMFGAALYLLSGNLSEDDDYKRHDFPPSKSILGKYKQAAIASDNEVCSQVGK